MCNRCSVSDGVDITATGWKWGNKNALHLPWLECQCTKITAGKARKASAKMPLVSAALYRDLFHISAQCQWPRIPIQKTVWRAIDFVDWLSECSPKAFLLSHKRRCWHDLQHLAQQTLEVEASFSSQSPKATSSKTLLISIEPDAALQPAAIHRAHGFRQPSSLSASPWHTAFLVDYTLPWETGHFQCALNALQSRAASTATIDTRDSYGRWAFTRSCSRT